MKRFQRLFTSTSAAVLTLSSLLSLGFTGVAHAATQTCDWIGGTDLKFSTAANWSNCGGGSPLAGDIIALNNTANATETLTNDLSVALGGVVISNTLQTGVSTAYFISTLTLAANATILDQQTASTNGTSVYIGTSYSNLAPLTAQGNLVLSSGGYSFDMKTGAWDVAGTLTLGTGVNITAFVGTTPSSAYKTALNASAITIQNGAVLNLDPGTSSTPAYSTPLTFGGGSGTIKPEVQFWALCTPGAMACTYSTATWSVTSPVTLLGDAYIAPAESQSVVNFTGSITGSGYVLAVDPSMPGTLTLNPSSNNSSSAVGKQVAVATTSTLSDNLPSSDITVGANITDILDGSRRNVVVYGGGTLKGTGAMTSLIVDTGGIVAPGHSPGTLTVLSSLALSAGSIYQEEIKDASPGDFDQIVAGNAADTTGNDVTLGDTNGSPTLVVSLYTGYKINKGDQFEIINNLSQTPVKGTFASLPEGATFKVSGYVFKISYVGGTGNDVTLTVVSVPTAPDTGFAFVSANPVMSLALMAGAAGAIMVVARRIRPAHAVAHKSTRRK